MNTLELEQKKTGERFTCMVVCETHCNPETLFGSVYCSFPNQAHARFVFWLAEHFRINSTVYQTLLHSLFQTFVWLCWSECPDWWLELSLLAEKILLSIWIPVLLRLFVATTTFVCWETLLRTIRSDWLVLPDRLPHRSIVLYLPLQDEHRRPAVIRNVQANATTTKTVDVDLAQVWPIMETHGFSITAYVICYRRMYDVLTD